MSIMRCESCERQVDTDFEEGGEINGDFYCDTCMEAQEQVPEIEEEGKPGEENIMDEKKVRKALKFLEDRYSAAETDAAWVKKLLNEALAPEPRFYVGQPVLVSNDTEKVFWHKGFFDSYMTTANGDIVGYQPFVVRLGEGTRWHHCKPDPDAVSLPNWIEHDGSSKKFITEIDGYYIWTKETERYTSGGKLDSGREIELEGIFRYCIIPLPQWIDQ